MIETFVRLVDGENDASTSSVWQGILTFQTNISITQLVNQTVQAAGRAAGHIDPPSYNWRFLFYNHKFGEYCDTNSRDKRVVCDGDKFQLIYVSKNEQTRTQANAWPATSEYANRASAIAEVQNQTPLVFLDDEREDIKPSLDLLIRQTTSTILSAANEAIEADQRVNNREVRRGSTRHLPSELIRQLENDFDEDEIEEENEFVEDNSRTPSPKAKVMKLLQQENGSGRKRRRLNNNNNYEGEEDPAFKPRVQNRRNSSIVSEAGSGDKLEEGLCSKHTHASDLCSHTKFRNINALEILNSVPTGQMILDHLRSANSRGDEIDQNVRCKLMNAIGTFLMHNADSESLPTAVERRILVHTFLKQLPCRLDPTVFTNKGGTGCLDYWVRNRRKTTVSSDGKYMVRGSKKRPSKRNSTA